MISNHTDTHLFRTLGVR